MTKPNKKPERTLPAIPEDVEIVEQIDEAVPIESQKAIILQEIQVYLNTRFQLMSRHKVNKLIGAEESVLKQIENELIKVQIGIDLYKKQYAELIKLEKKTARPGKPETASS